MNPTALSFRDSHYPVRLRERLGDLAPKALNALGNLATLSERNTGLFCSVRFPGDAILGAYDSARTLRKEGVTVVSGFHSPVEKECLRILLRRKQPIIICLERALEKIRLPAAWRLALDAGRLLILSPFEKYPPRPTNESAQRRNNLLAAVCDEVLIIHAESGGSVAQIFEVLKRWGVPKRQNGA